MQQTLEETNTTKGKATESSNLLVEVSNMITNMNVELESIAAAVTQQSTISDDIAKRQVDVSEIAESSFKKAEQSLSSSNKLDELSKRLEDSLAII